MAGGFNVLRDNFDDIYDLRFRAENILGDLMTKPMVSQNLFYVDDTTLKEERVSAVGGYSSLDEVGEGEDIPKAVPVQGYDKTYTPLKYAKRIGISLEARQDDPKGIFKSLENQVRKHAKAAQHTAETAAAAIFINAASSTSCPDGQYLADTQHPKNPDESSTVYDNYITDALADASDIEVMFKKIADNGFDMAGHPLDASRWILLVPPALKGKALGAVKQLYYPSGNVYAAPTPITTGELMGNITVLDWAYIGAAMGGSDTAWYFVQDPTEVGSEHSLRFYWRIRPTYMIDGLEPSVDQKNGDWYVPFLTRFTCGCHDWRHVWMSSGGG
jgi:hypothetical protein